MNTYSLPLLAVSLAASLIAGNNRSGLDAWSNQEGFTLKQSGFGKKE